MISIVFILSATYFQAQNQILNPGFEDGDSVNVDGWVMDPFGSHRSTQYVNSGNYSLSVYNWYTYVPGVVGNGDGGVSSISGTPINVLPVSMSGFYLYDTTNTLTSADSAIVEVFLKKYDAVTNLSNTVAYGISKLEATDMTSAFQPFDVILNEIIPNVTPDTIIVMLKSSETGICTGSNCLYFYVDDLSLNLPLGINIPFNPEKGVEFWPNPVKDILNFSTLYESGKIEIFNMNGKLIYTQLIQNNEIVNIEFLKPGSYLLSIEHNGNKEIHKLIK